MGNNQSQIQVNKSVIKGIFAALGSFFGMEGKENKIQMQKQEELEKELEAIRKEEEKLGATKRINKLSDTLQSYRVDPEKLKTTNKVPKIKTANIKETKKIKNEEREIGD